MAPPDEREDIDPGLARERTRLSWARTAIAFAAVGATILKRQPVAGLIVLAVTPVIWGLGRLVAQEEGEEHGPRARRLLLVTVIVTLVAALALVVALVGHGPGSLRELLPLHG